MHTFTNNIYITLLNCKDHFKVFALNSLERDEKAVIICAKPICICTGCCHTFHSLPHFPIKEGSRFCLLHFEQLVKGTQSTEKQWCVSLCAICASSLRKVSH